MEFKLPKLPDGAMEAMALDLVLYGFENSKGLLNELGLFLPSLDQAIEDVKKMMEDRKAGEMLAQVDQTMHQVFNQIVTQAETLAAHQDVLTYKKYGGKTH